MSGHRQGAPCPFCKGIGKLSAYQDSFGYYAIEGRDHMWQTPNCVLDCHHCNGTKLDPSDQCFFGKNGAVGTHGTYWIRCIHVLDHPDAHHDIHGNEMADARDARVRK